MPDLLFELVYDFYLAALAYTLGAGVGVNSSVGYTILLTTGLELLLLATDRWASYLYNFVEPCNDPT